MPVERAVIEPLRLEEHHRVGIFDRGNQQALGIIGIGRHDDLEAADMGKQRLRALAVRLSAKNAAAGRHAHDDRTSEIAVGAITDPRRLLRQLVIGRIHVVGELDLDTGFQPIGGHADGGADDAGFVDRRVETAGLAVFRLQALGAAENAAEITDILAEDHDILIPPHCDIHGASHSLDHRHPGHVSILPSAAGGADAAASRHRRLRRYRARRACRRHASFRVPRPCAGRRSPHP
ncbi:hypothetical protein D3C71_1232340 [compost metagenome]